MPDLAPLGREAGITRHGSRTVHYCRSMSQASHEPLCKDVLDHRRDTRIVMHVGHLRSDDRLCAKCRRIDRVAELTVAGRT